MLESRTPKQCRERYHQNLKPTLNHSPITDEEGAYIEQLVAQYGKKWAEIARHLTGRSDNAVKNWWNGGANRRRRASLQVTSPMDQPQSGYNNIVHNQQMNGGPPVFANPFGGDNGNSQGQGGVPSGNTPTPGTPGTPNPYYNANYPPPPPSNIHPALYQSMGHRVSLPNIYSDSFNSMRNTPTPTTQPIPPAHTPTPTPNSPFSSPQYTSMPSQSSRKRSAVVFNSAYTSDSSGFRKSSAVTVSSTVDPHQPHDQQHDSIPTDPNLPGASSIVSASPSQPGPIVGTKTRSHRRAGSLHHGTSASPFQRRRAHLGDDDALAPFARRFSATTTTTTTTTSAHRSSRANSISGLSSASDTEEPIMPPSAYSLSRYSLSNSTSSSRRSSHVIPQLTVTDPTVLPPLSNGLPVSSIPATAPPTSTTASTPSAITTTATSTSPPSQPSVVFNSNYASASGSPSPSFPPQNEHRQSISSVNSLLQQSHLQSQRPSISAPSSASSISSTTDDSNTPTLKVESNNPAIREPKLKISNLLS